MQFFSIALVINSRPALIGPESSITLSLILIASQAPSSSQAFNSPISPNQMAFFLQNLITVILSLLCASASGYNYWVDPDCNDNIRDALKEAIWVAERVGYSISIREAWLEEPMQWWFAMSLSSSSTEFVISG